jgi:peptide deformylase
MILQSPNLMLKSKAKKVDAEFVRSPEFKKLLIKMSKAMDDAGGIGIAAPQIGQSYQVAIIRPDFIEPAMSHLHILINPTYFPKMSSLITMEEGCLSVDRGTTQDLVRRYSAIEVISDVLQHDGRLKTVSAHVSGFLARIVQHEVQHLHGILYIDKLLEVHDYNEVLR